MDKLTVSEEKLGNNEEKKRSANFQGLLAAFFYGICSVCMTFANKAAMNTYNFNYQFFLIFAQMVFTVLMLETLRWLNLVSLPRYTLSRGWNFIAPSMLYAIHSVLSLSALSGMNIPMYAVVKRCAPLVILLLGMVILKKGPPTMSVSISVALITVGCFIAGYGDISFDLEAYTYGAISVFTQSTYLLLVQKAAQSQTTTETLHLNSYNTLPVLFICSIIFGEFSGAISHFDPRNIGFLLTFLVVIIMGSLLNYLLFLCTILTSALTTSITGTLKSILQTAIGIFTFGGISINIFTITGISINFAGGILYSVTKYRDSQKKQLGDMKRARSSSEMEGCNGHMVVSVKDDTNSVANV